MIAIIFFIIGACIGSFLNVAIYRIRHNISVLTPPSFCPECKTPLKFYHNLPIIGYIILKGKCSFCKKKISARYIIVEFLSAVFAPLYLLKFGFTPDFVFFFLFTSLLIITSFIDAQTGIIPDAITVPFILIGFALSFFSQQTKPLSSFLGIIAGTAPLILSALVYKGITKKDGMGGGDIKFLAMIGAFTGFKGAIFTVITSSFIGSVAGGIILVFIRKKKLKPEHIKRVTYKNSISFPFAPFLSAGAVIYIFFGQTLIDWYLNLFKL